MNNKLNLNDKIFVCLTDLGFEILRTEYRTCVTEEEFYNFVVKKVEEDWVFETTLWDFAAIFGHYFYNGAPRCIKDNILLLK